MLDVAAPGNHIDKLTRSICAGEIVIVADLVDFRRGTAARTLVRGTGKVHYLIGALPHHKVLALIQTASGTGQIICLADRIGIDVGIAHREIIEVNGTDSALLRHHPASAFSHTGSITRSSAAETLLPRIHRGYSHFRRYQLLLHRLTRSL